MNRLLSWLQSWQRSSKRRKLQLQICTSNPVSPNPLVYAIMLLSRRPDDADRALAAYFELCESDERVAEVMRTEQISRSGLHEIYRHLLANGLDRWVKGHHAALSTIAYADPLYFASRAPNKGMEWREVAYALLRYWEGSLSNQELRDRVK